MRLGESVQYTEDQKAQFKQLYSKRRRNQLMLSVPLVAVMLAVAVTEDRQANTILGLPAQVAGPIFLAMIVGALVFSFRNWRCPACDKYFGRTFNPRHCHNCGIELRK